MLFVTCPPHLENLLFQELTELGITDLRIGHHGVFAKKELLTVYKINYCSRIATRCLWPLLEFRSLDQKALYEAAYSIQWAPFLKPSQTFAIDANVSHPLLRNSLYATQVMKDGICDQIRAKTGERPSVDIQNPTIQLNLHIHNNTGIISLDTSGAPLFKRGWRTEASPASIQENLAAGLLRRIGYQGESLCDPLCGSGTFLVEAAMIASHTPPGFLRKEWGFLHHPDHDQQMWESLRASEDAKRKELPSNTFFGADADPSMVRATQRHLKNLSLLASATLLHSEINHYRPPVTPEWLLTNPPFGKRLQTSLALYQSLGQFMKRYGKKTFFIAPNTELATATNCRNPRPLFTFQHGGLPIGLFSGT